MALIGFYDAIEYVMIAGATLSPIVKFSIFGAKYICPGAPTIVGKTTPEGKKSAFQLSPPFFPREYNPSIFFSFVNVHSTVANRHSSCAGFIIH